ncbi:MULTISPECIES: lactate utilization protein C [unclassified Micromonospora]|uniref:LutC/YkgG family protein n=1 Tax=unclassified Micromonospora TaxID=2617518 RepID=UPI003645A3BC
MTRHVPAGRPGRDATTGDRPADTARAEVLRRVRLAVGTQPPGVGVPRDYRGAGSRPVDDPVGLFVQRLTDYRASAYRCGAAEVGATVTGILGERGRTRICVPHDLPAQWTAPDWQVIPGGVLPDPAALAAFDGVVTGCALAIALTGTIVLDSGPGQGWRAVTLVPDYHLVVVRADQIVPAVPDAIARLDATRPMTWISGPSATSDIEFDRVEGVHGPRTLDVLVVAEPG